MGPFDRFNDRAKRVLALAQDEAIRFNHNYIGTEHLLLGLMREGEGVAARVLDSLSVDLSRLRSEVETTIGRAPLSNGRCRKEDCVISGSYLNPIRAHEIDQGLHNQSLRQGRSFG